MSERDDALLPYVDLLASSRRVDWRFLLPDPELGHVVCAGGANPDLKRSCLLFSRSLSVLGQETGKLARDSADVLVLVDPGSAALEEAVGLLKPDGWVYVEVHRPPTYRGLGVRRPRTTKSYAGELRRLGLDRIESHWHWPDFESCTEILPLADRTVLRGALARRRARRWSPRMWLARVLVAFGLLPFVVTHASVIAHRPASAEHE